MWEQHLARKEMVGDYDILANFSYGGMPYELVYEQMKRFADKVMPKLKGDDTKASPIPADSRERQSQ